MNHCGKKMAETGPRIMTGKPGEYRVMCRCAVCGFSDAVLVRG